MEILISVVVPIYNVEPYLRRCIDSIINQTYRHLEIILVNDGSTDRCGDICDEYAEHDERIKVIHKENGGVSDARNVGMSMAAGKYISFVDSDDYLVNDAYEVLLREAETYELDILTGNAFDNVNIDGKLCWESIDCELVRQGLDFICYGKTVIPVYPGLHLVNLNFVRKVGIEFKKDYLHEDILWTHELFFYADKVKFKNFPFYCRYRRGPCPSQFGAFIYYKFIVKY